MQANKDLPFASTLCGSCSNVCPVKINIHEQLYLWRQEITKEGLAAKGKTFAMWGMSEVLAHPAIYRMVGKMGRWVVKHLPFLTNNAMNPWFKQREMPEAPKESFRDWYLNNKQK
jgi:L-lactate dehydrogenase complex protein LldF